MSAMKIRESMINKDISDHIDKQIINSLAPPVPFIIGKKYIIRTITMINIGRLIAITGNFLTIDDASWIADAGTWEKCLTDPNGIKISEKFRKPVHININSIVDGTEWELALPETSISRMNN